MSQRSGVSTVDATAATVSGARLVDVDTLQATGRQHRQDRVVIEEPLEIRIGSVGQPPQPLTVTMRTPGADLDLALGFLHGEGLIRSATELHALDRSDERVLQLEWLRTPPVISGAQRQFMATSSCGVCGKRSIEDIDAMRVVPRVAGAAVVRREVLAQLPAMLRASQGLFQSTGGLHAVGLFSLEGRLLAIHEDVGRHNAMDKLVGAALRREDLPLAASMVLLSGRASFELLQKAAMAGIPIVAAIGAPSTLAIEIAQSAGQTLVGFLRADSLNVYCGAERVLA